MTRFIAAALTSLVVAIATTVVISRYLWQRNHRIMSDEAWRDDDVNEYMLWNGGQVP